MSFLRKQESIYVEVWIPHQVRNDNHTKHPLRIINQRFPFSYTLLVFQVDFPDNRPSQENEPKVIVYRRNAMRSICRVSSFAIVPLLLVMLSPCVVSAGGAVEFERIDPSYLQTDANSLIDIDSHKDHMISAESLKIVFKNEGL